MKKLKALVDMEVCPGWYVRAGEEFELSCDDCVKTLIENKQAVLVNEE